MEQTEQRGEHDFEMTIRIILRGPLGDLRIEFEILTKNSTLSHHHPMNAFSLPTILSAILPKTHFLIVFISAQTILRKLKTFHHHQYHVFVSLFLVSLYYICSIQA